MAKKYKVNKNEAEMEQFHKDMREADEQVDAFLDELEKSNDDLSLTIYKYGIAFARMAVANEVDVDKFIYTCLTMYERMGGKVEEGDTVTDGYEVPSDQLDEEGNPKWLH